MPVKVLVVDDSAFMRQMLSHMIEDDSELRVVGIAHDGEEALMKIMLLKPDVVTLDVEMPKMDGLKCLAKIMEEMPLPVLMVSYLTSEGTETTFKALELGAVDFISKPSYNDPEAVRGIHDELIQKIKIAATIKQIKLSRQELEPSLAIWKPKSLTRLKKLEILAVGTSTGGPKALSQLLPLFPKNFPLGIVVGQHMPKGFTKVFANRLDQICQMQVIEAEQGDEVIPGRICIAPAGYQTKVIKSNNQFFLEIFDQPNQIYKPSVDILFKSVASIAKNRVLAVIMTGMGSDGAAGLKMIRDLGGRTIAEAEETCVVYGMPRVAVEIGGAEYVERLPDIFSRITKIIDEE